MSRAMQRINAIYSDPSVSPWLKTMLRSCLGRSIHEVANEATVLAVALQEVAYEFSDQDGALVKDEEHPCAVVLQFPGKKRS